MDGGGLPGGRGRGVAQRVQVVEVEEVKIVRDNKQVTP